MDGKTILIEEEEQRTHDPDFWNEPKSAEEQLKKIARLKSWVEGYDRVKTAVDDLYVLYNVIAPNDQVKARTFRRIRQNDDEGRADKGERVPMVLTLVVEEAKFHEFANRLRIKGKVIAGPEDLISLHD